MLKVQPGLLAAYSKVEEQRDGWREEPFNPKGIGLDELENSQPTKNSTGC